MEYGYESTPRKTFEHSYCFGCGRRTLAVYWDARIFRCHYCGVSGWIHTDEHGDYPGPPLEQHPFRRGYG